MKTEEIKTNLIVEYITKESDGHSRENHYTIIGVGKSKISKTFIENWQIHAHEFFLDVFHTKWYDAVFYKCLEDGEIYAKEIHEFASEFMISN